MTLNPKQRKFCEEYLVDMNAGAAYLRAGYSASSPRQEGYRLLQNAEVQAHIQILRSGQAGAVEVQPDMVVAELAAIAMARLEDVVEIGFDGELTLKPLERMTTNGRAALQSIQAQPGKGVKVTLCNKLQALELLGKYLGLFSDFNAALITLRKYGLEVKQTEAGWEVSDVNAPAA